MIAATRTWAAQRPDVQAVGHAGSGARDDACVDSDVDFVILTTDTRAYLENDAWVRELAGLRVINTRAWRPLTERRFVLLSGLEVDVGIAPPSWAATAPVDTGTRRVVLDGLRVVHDPGGLLARLVEACR